MILIKRGVYIKKTPDTETKVKPLRIFIGFSEVANFYSNLVNGLEDLGVKYTFFRYGRNRFGYSADNRLSRLQKIMYFFTDRMSGKNSGKMRAIFYRIVAYVYRFFLFIYFSARHDVFAFSYNSSFMSLYDLPILRLFNKKIIYLYHGSDNRPPYINGNYILGDYSIEEVFQLTKNLYGKHKKIEKYADIIVSVPPVSQFFCGKITDFYCLGMPVDFRNIIEEKVETEESTGNGKVINIIHAPSTKKQKGSHIIRSIIKDLKQEGYKINYEELHGLPNRTVLQKIANCDIVIDQVYSDAPVAGFAAEAAFFSKPVVVGGYYDNMEKDFKCVPVPPAIYVEPDEMKNALIRLLEDPAFRKESGHAMKDYVDKYWKPKVVAENFLKIIEEKTPDTWQYDSSQCEYFFGWGVSKEDLRDFLRRYLDKYGREGLFLEHNPKLADRIEAFAEGRV